MSDLERRDFLKAVGAALAAGCKAPSGETDGTDVPCTGPQIDHVVFVMMENRSFDHYFGSLSLSGERPEVDGLTAEHANTSSQGEHRPYPLVTGWCPPDPPHGWNSNHDQFAEGANSGFCAEFEQRHPEADPGLVMGYAERATLPVSYALADHYVLCDRWFCAVLGPTWPNRLYAHGAQSEGATTNDLPSGPFTMRTLWDQLEEAGIPWGYYYQDLPFIGLFANANHWVDAGRVQEIDAFFEACASGALPAVSFVEPAFSFNDDHPPHHPLLGQVFLASVHNALASSPAWGRTLLVITYDEHGGFYDHVPPPTIADDRPDEGFGQLGFRVPALVCGPWVRSGHVDHTEYTHTSWLRTVQGLHGLPPLNARDEASNDLSAALDPDRCVPLEPAVLPVIPLTREEIEASCADDASNQPELLAFLERHAPHLVRDRAEAARKQLAWAERLGAVVVER